MVPVPSDFPTLKALAEVGVDMLQKVGLNVEPRYTDWGSMIKTLTKTEPVEDGGWSAFFTYWSGLDQFELDMRGWFTRYPGRPDYFTHWGGAFKYAASVLGLPIGSHPHSRPPQAILPASAKTQIRQAYVRPGLCEG